MAAGVLVLAFIALGEHRPLGLALLAASLIPLGDMSIVLLARGRVATALSVHGATTALMIVAAAPLMLASA